MRADIRLAGTIAFALLSGCGATQEATANEGAPPIAEANVQAQRSSIPPPQAAGLTELDRGNLENEVMRRKPALLYAEFLGGQRRDHYCSEFVEYGISKITDTRINGTSGEIVVITPTTWKKWYGTGPNQLAPCGLGIGQTLGQRMRVQDRYRIEKWDSGWKIVN